MQEWRVQRIYCSTLYCEKLHQLVPLQVLRPADIRPALTKALCVVCGVGEAETVTSGSDATALLAWSSTKR